ncbi:hypothetical protein [Scytonema sp. PCC 10023]|uniref:hypothetical protein n=1 Tax=Scytonema sp. PCC 10023 TaxID=1680591 RepID=UPI0039C6642D
MLLVAAQKLGRESLRDIAQQQAAWVVKRAEQTGAYQLFTMFLHSPTPLADMVLSLNWKLREL